MCEQKQCSMESFKDSALEIEQINQQIQTMITATRVEKQGLWQKRYRMTQKSRQQQLNQEMEELMQELEKVKQVNSQLKSEIQSKQGVESQDSNQVQEYYQDYQETGEDSEEDNRFLNLEIVLPSEENIRSTDIKKLKSDAVIKIYKDWYYNFSRLLIQIENPKQQLLAQEELRKSSENYDKFINGLQFDNPQMMNFLMTYNFDTQQNSDWDMRVIDEHSKKIMEVINITDEQIENAYYCSKKGRAEIEHGLMGLRQQVQIISKKADNPPTCDGVIIKHGLLDAVEKFDKIYREGMDMLKRSAINDTPRWITPKQLAKSVVFSYPKVLVMHSLQDVVADKYTEDYV